MMDLSHVSRTAILLLIARAVQGEKCGLDDPVAALCLERLESAATGDLRRWMDREKRVYQGIQANHARAGVRRAKAFDEAASRFIAANPGCTVINLACGFDTRFWRIEHEQCTYIELDLPEVIELKKEILKDQVRYEMIGCSVLDTAWMDQVTNRGNAGFFLIAEGLFPWLVQPDAVRLFKEIGERFSRSQLVFDAIPESYTRGIWKFFMRLETRITWGLDVAWTYGIKSPREIESYCDRLAVIAVEKGSAGPIITVSVDGVEQRV